MQFLLWIRLFYQKLKNKKFAVSIYINIIILILIFNTMKKIILICFFVFLWTGIVFAANNFLKYWENWDANINNTQDSNDSFDLNWRLNLEDSRSTEHKSWYRWNITWKIKSDLFWNFDIDSEISLNFKSKNPNKSKCWDKESLELYKISWKISSLFWWEMNIDDVNSYFCSNKYLYIKLISDSIWLKEIWNNGIIQWNLVDDFWKQEISISWISRIKWNTNEWILNRWDWEISNLDISQSMKSLSKKYINKNIAKIFKTYNNTNYIKSGSYNSFIKEFLNLENENYYLYNYLESSENISFKNTWDYINEWKILEIGDWDINYWVDKIGINWKHTIVLKWWNVYINSNIYNENNKSLLIIISKRINNKWWNIYINPNVTNIDAVLISDGSLISLDWTNIQNSLDNNQKNNLRKQLFIYWSIFSSNSIWSDKMPYWTDYYKNISYSNNEMPWSIYDLWNLRTFNLNYWEDWKECSDGSKLSPIDWNWNYIKNAWAWRKECYNSDNWDDNLRKSNKKNPLIIEYNSRIKLINPFILRNN